MLRNLYRTLQYLCMQFFSGSCLVLLHLLPILFLIHSHHASLSIPRSLFCAIYPHSLIQFVPNRILCTHTYIYILVLWISRVHNVFNARRQPYAPAMDGYLHR